MNDRTADSRHYLRILALVSFVVALVSARSVGRPSVADLALWDEVFYMENGLGMLKGMSPGTFWGPVYSAWYSMLGLVVEDRVTLLRASWIVLLALNLVAWCLLAGRLKLGKLVVVVGATWLATARVLDCGPPHVVLFAGGIVSLGMAVALRSRTAAGGLAVAAAFVGALVFARPELISAFAFLVVAYLWAALRDRHPVRAAGVAVLTGTMPFVILALVFVGGFRFSEWRQPMSQIAARFHGAWALYESRSFLAFGQHYALNVKLARGGSFDPFQEWPPVVAASFGTATSTAAAFRANPGEFLWNVQQNAKGLLMTSVFALAPRIGTPPRFEWAEGSLPRNLEFAAGASVGLVLAAGVAMALCAFRRGRRVPAADEQQIMVVLAVLAALLVAQAAALMVVRPRPHHLPQAVIPLMAVAGWGWSRRYSAAHSAVASAVAMAFVTLALPSRAGGFPWYAGSTTPAATRHTPVRAVAELLGNVEVPRDRPLRLLERGYGHAFYLGWLVQKPSPDASLGVCATFSTCIVAFDPDVVIADAELQDYYLRQGDVAFGLFLEDPTRFGYVSFRTAVTADRVMAKRALAKGAGVASPPLQAPAALDVAARLPAPGDS